MMKNVQTFPAHFYIKITYFNSFHICVNRKSISSCTNSCVRIKRSIQNCLKHCQRRKFLQDKLPQQELQITMDGKQEGVNFGLHKGERLRIIILDKIPLCRDSNSRKKPRLVRQILVTHPDITPTMTNGEKGSSHYTNATSCGNSTYTPWIQGL